MAQDASQPAPTPHTPREPVPLLSLPAPSQQQLLPQPNQDETREEAREEARVEGEERQEEVEEEEEDDEEEQAREMQIPGRERQNRFDRFDREPTLSRAGAAAGAFCQNP